MDGFGGLALSPFHIVLVSTESGASSSLAGAASQGQSRALGHSLIEILTAHSGDYIEETISPERTKAKALAGYVARRYSERYSGSHVDQWQSGCWRGFVLLNALEFIPPMN